MTIEVCHICGRRSGGLGLTHKKDTRWLCVECAQIVDRISVTRRFDPFELKALDDGVDAVGDWIATNGNKTELSEYDELERRMLVQAAVRGWQEGLRRRLANGEAPF